MPLKGSSPDNGAPDHITIKKYANRRLYNTAKSAYVTLENLAAMVKAGVEFTVHDAKSGEDITRAVLTQIIVEQEAKGHSLLPTGFLRQLISFYGDSLQGLVPQYLDIAMRSFAHNQENMRKSLENAFDDMSPLSSFEEVDRKNMAVFEQAMSMMESFKSGVPASKAIQPEMISETRESAEAIDLLRVQLEAMQRQLDFLSSGKIS
ncbi:MAG: polyhydroxyalkanoate synthesis repressor PhaR [Pseudomonadota bacterium]|nr:polyhydroxyalkanoate synthesis repressor PhaR [Pseudomonadota bacterium]